ncbi:MAG: beta-lactamase family protein, partial [Kordiimonadaceae bacterium]|nr:beta-lactamase family protein [Kordiimonadaceae bacterium]
MRILRGFLLVLSAVLFMPLVGLAAEEPNPQADFLANAYKTNDFNGSVLIDNGSGHQVMLGYGYADKAGGKLATPQTRFYLASISKQFTAVMTLMLVEDGALALDDTLGTLMPQFAADGSPAATITLHQLLSHQSGLHEFYDGMTYEELVALAQSDILLSDMIARLDRTLIFKPGSQGKYADTNFILLSAILEQKSGLSYDALLKQRILSPLGLTNTGYYHSSGDDAALTYRSMSPAYDRAILINRAVAFGASALYSTVEDLSVFADALYRGSLLPAGARALMLTPHTTFGTSAYGYGTWLERWNICGIDQ